jgi:hypothetical protein
MDEKHGASSGQNAIECQTSSRSVRQPKARNPKAPGEKQTDSIYDHFDTKSFRFWEREISRRRFPTSPELADLLEANSGNAWPIGPSGDRHRRQHLRP